MQFKKKPPKYIQSRMVEKNLFLLKKEKKISPLFCWLEMLEMSQRNTIGLIIFSSFCLHSSLRTCTSL